MTTRKRRIPNTVHVFTALLDKGEQTVAQLCAQCLMPRERVHIALVTLEKARCAERDRSNKAHLWRIGQRVHLGVALLTNARGTE